MEHTTNNSQTQQQEKTENSTTVASSAFLDPMWEEYNQLLASPFNRLI